jgi:hypothetical protein
VWEEGEVPGGKKRRTIIRWINLNKKKKLKHDSYDRRIQLGASRRRREDGEVLHKADHWAGAMYLGGYAIECALKALICYRERKNNFKDTRAYSKIDGNSLHNLGLLLAEVPAVQRAITMDHTNTYRPAWYLITRLWRKDQLRYWDKKGNKQDSTNFLEAVKIIHDFLLAKQG